MTKAAENEPITNGHFFWRVPKPATWRVVIFPGYEYRPSGDYPVPNVFNRLMQRLIFGFKWERIK